MDAHCAGWFTFLYGPDAMESLDITRLMRNRQLFIQRHILDKLMRYRCPYA